jgi:hypothetical protein
VQDLIIATQAGVFTFGDGAGGTRMTLNSTGLGVGASPANDKILSLGSMGILLSGATSDFSFRNSVGTAIQRLRYTDATGTLTIGSATGTAYPVELGGNTTTRAVTIDASGNLGVGITNPSFRLHALVSSGADRDIFAAQVLAASNGLQVKWNHATTTLRIILANIPTSSAGLATGTLWNDAGTIKIA